jgi:hypothetical protein
MQLKPGPAYDHRLAERVVVYLQTKDPDLFPFAHGFDDARRKAFIRDLREALSDLQDSGSARKTSASGFIMRDQRLHEVVHEWAEAGGDWPRGADPRVPATMLGPTCCRPIRPADAGSANAPVELDRGGSLRLTTLGVAHAVVRP